jgi:hypothetical protein
VNPFWIDVLRAALMILAELLGLERLSAGGIRSRTSITVDRRSTKEHPLRLRPSPFLRMLAMVGRSKRASSDGPLGPGQAHLSRPISTAARPVSSPNSRSAA